MTNNGFWANVPQGDSWQQSSWDADGNVIASGGGLGGWSSSPHWSWREWVPLEEQQAQVYRLYLAAFSETPAEMDASVPIADVAGLLVEVIGEMDASDFVALLYANAFDREASEIETAYWVDALEQGWARADVLLGFSESTELIARIAADNYADTWIDHGALI